MFTNNGSIKDHKNKPKQYLRVAASILLCLLAILLFNTAEAAVQEKAVKVTIKAKNMRMLQDTDVPALKAEIEYKGKPETVLDKESGYTVQNLIDDLKAGKGYTLECRADGIIEGIYPVKTKVSRDIQQKVSKNWSGKVEIYTKNAQLTVANKYGSWDGDRFKRWDGTYIEKDFVVAQGDTYYFDSEGKKISGWQQIDNALYYFDKDGVMQVGWQEKDGVKYYLGKDGKAYTGWLTLKKDKYYFGLDGKMVTGKKKVGFQECIFGKDGKLESAKSLIDPNRPMVALTFDDGPGERTDELLEVLKKYDAHATFFMLGTRAAKHGSTIRKMKEYGCELGNHSKTHPQLTKLSKDGIQEEIGYTNKKVAEAAGEGASVLRPPYGAVNAKLRETAGMPLIMWSIDTLDWKTKSVKKTIETTMKHVKDGDIVLMHDIHSTSVDAAIKLIPKLIDKGYQLVTVSELASARGVTLENGKKYFSFYK